MRRQFWMCVGLLLGGVIIGGCTSASRSKEGRVPVNVRASRDVTYPPRFRIVVRKAKGGGIGDSKEGFIDATGHVVIPATFRSVGDFYEGLASVYNGDRQSIIDTNGKTVFSVPADCVTDGLFSEGLALVNVRGKTDYHRIEGGFWGYIDREGKFAIAARFFIPASMGYDSSMNGATHFSEGLAAMVSPEGKWGYINRLGEWVIQPRFVRAQGFSDGVAKVTLEEKAKRLGPNSSNVEEQWGYVDRKGRMLWSSRS